MAINLYDVLFQSAERNRNHPAILGPGINQRRSYGELLDSIRNSAARLDRAGVRPGDCVGLHYCSGADYIIWNYAVWMCGGCVVPVPVELTPREKQEVCHDIALQFVITAPESDSFTEPFRRAAAVQLAPGVACIPVAAERRRPPGFAAINAAFIRFTSGTTGTSKGVVLSHKSILERIHAANSALHLGPADRVLWLLSMSYHFAVSIVAYLNFGATIVLVPNHFPAAVLESACRSSATVIYGSPSHYAWLAACDRPGALPDLRLAISTTAALDATTAKRFRGRFGVAVAQALGIIEVGLPCINTEFAADRHDAVGRVLPAYRVRLDDVGLGPDLKEVLFAGHGFLDAYYEPWQTRAQIMPDGWFRTGDVGTLDADGCLFLRGRVKDVINVGGMKFFPSEVESVLAAHPGVAGASVFGRHDERLGEIPHARVVARHGSVSESELLQFCTSRLATFKVPQRIEFIAELPRTPSGKILRREPHRPAVHGDTEPTTGS